MDTTMTKVLILGAGGQTAQWVIEMLAERDTIQLTLFARDTSRLRDRAPKDATIIKGDILDAPALSAAVKGQDVVVSAASGPVDRQAGAIIAAMDAAGVRRLIFVGALGIYDELPPRFNAWNRATLGPLLKPFRRAADAIEASDLNYTYLRPAWLTDEDEVDYETTSRHETYKGTEVSRKSVAALIVDLTKSPGKGVRENLGVNKPGTDGDKPAFY
jgi:uncharacterized protein YbjT (DUF2867 family)